MDKSINDIQKEIQGIFEKYKGLSFDEIGYEIGLNPKMISSKTSIVTIVNALFAFEKFNWKSLSDRDGIKSISLKTVRLNPTGIPAEAMSFEQVRFMELVNECWEKSVLRNKFRNTVFLFVVFQYEKNSPKQHSNLIFKGIKLWRMPLDTLDGKMKNLWEKTKSIVEKGVKLEEVKKGNKIIIKNNLPGMNDNPVAHIRPKAKDSNDKTELPSGQFIVKQAYWLNSRYIAEVLNDLPEIERRTIGVPMEISMLTPEQIQILKSKFNKSIYTTEEFIEKALHNLSSFSRFHINNENLSKIGYKLTPHFIISNEVDSVDQYFEEVVFKNDYFIKPKTEVFDSPYFNRKLENLQNAYRVFEIEERTYITDDKLRQADIKKEMLIDYKNKVEDFADSKGFFTVKQLERMGFNHELNNYGFDSVFYENILTRPGRLKVIKIAGQNVFLKSNVEILGIADFILSLFYNESSVEIDELHSRLVNTYCLSLNIDNLIRSLKESELFYSEEMKKVYIDKETFYSEVYS